jgi:DNA repair protein RadC
MSSDENYEMNATSSCGCKHVAQTAQEDLPKLSRGLPAIAEGFSAEPLLALEDGVYECADGSCGTNLTHSVIPSGIRFDTVRKNPQGLYEASSSTIIDIPAQLREAWEVTGPAHGPNRSCLPWVRISRDPQSFSGCLAAARQLGPMKYPKSCFKLMQKWFSTQDQEVFVVVLLDTQLQVRGVGEISRGARDSVQTPIPDILRLPIVEGAKAMIVMHNHPSGKVNPSKADKALTKTLKQACDTVNIDLFDHLVVGPNEYFSFANEGLLKH